MENSTFEQYLKELTTRYNFPIMPQTYFIISFLVWKQHSWVPPLGQLADICSLLLVWNNYYVHLCFLNLEKSYKGVIFVS